MSAAWSAQPKIPNGWELIKDTLYDGKNPVIGHPYRHYSLRKVKEGGCRDEDDGAHISGK